MRCCLFLLVGIMLCACNEAKSLAEMRLGIKLPQQKETIEFADHFSLGGDYELTLRLLYTASDYEKIEKKLLTKGIYKPLSKIEPHMTSYVENVYIKNCKGYFFYDCNKNEEERPWYMLIILNQSRYEIYIYDLTM